MAGIRVAAHVGGVELFQEYPQYLRGLLPSTEAPPVFGEQTEAFTPFSGSRQQLLLFRVCWPFKLEHNAEIISYTNSPKAGFNL